MDVQYGKTIPVRFKMVALRSVVGPDKGICQLKRICSVQWMGHKRRDALIPDIITGSNLTPCACQYCQEMFDLIFLRMLQNIVTAKTGKG